ncbi:MAG: hypothetical protein H6819_01900 [Phycisphaerales bacterium]|nr:hypothetical protein [Phycisphaerales bacterium]MCB9857036.1 hypothetical protein [Phycisphaerales bacterium]MCB9861837.1 hypothetical protein [Phycisphaerales bacterium]
MDYLNKQLEYIRNQLGTLSRSGQIAAGLLVLLVVIGATWMANYYGSGSSWTPLLDQAVSADEAQRIQAELTIVGIDTKVEGDRILVSGGQDARQRSQAILAQKGALPRDMSLGFQSLIEKSNPFIGDKEMDRRWNVGLQTEIAEVIKHFGGIRNATVLIQVPRKRGFLMSAREKGSASASVNVEVDYGSRLSDGQVMAIANFVSGAVEGLLPTNVSITDGTRHYRTPDPSESLATNMLDKQREEERHYREMIYDQLQFVKGLVANVRVKLRDEEVSTENKELGKPSVKSETEETSDTRSASNAAGPGVRPNQGASVANGGAGNSSTTNTTKTEFSEQRDVKLTSVHKPMGLLEMLTASISVPHSYLEGVYRKKNAVPDDQPVTHEQIEAIAAIELPDIAKQIQTLLYEEEVQQKQIAQVAVDWHYDIPMQSAEAAAAALASASVDYVAMVKQYGPQAGLVLLAVVPLWFVLRMAKKAQVAVGAKGTAGGADKRGPQSMELDSLGGGPITVGEAEGMHSAMVGHEVDESVVRTQQIMEQIADLVKEDPDSAANIVQNWLQESGV